MLEVEKSHSPTRERILAAARECFSQYGFHRASMKNICKQSNISPGTFYHHFPSKEALIEEIIIDDRIRAFARIEKYNDDIVGYLVKNLLEIRKEHPAQRALVIEIMAEGMRNELVSAMLVRKHDAIISATQSLLLHAQEKGQVGKDVDTQSAAVLLLSLMYGILVDTRSSIKLIDKKRKKALSDMVCGILHIPVSIES